MCYLHFILLAFVCKFLFSEYKKKKKKKKSSQLFKEKDPFLERHNIRLQVQKTKTIN